MRPTTVTHIEIQTRSCYFFFLSDGNSDISLSHCFNCTLQTLRGQRLRPLCDVSPKDGASSTMVLPAPPGGCFSPESVASVPHSLLHHPSFPPRPTAPQASHPGFHPNSGLTWTYLGGKKQQARKTCLKHCEIVVLLKTTEL